MKKHSFYLDLLEKLIAYSEHGEILSEPTQSKVFGYAANLLKCAIDLEKAKDKHREKHVAMGLAVQYYSGVYNSVKHNSDWVKQAALSNYKCFLPTARKCLGIE